MSSTFERIVLKLTTKQFKAVKHTYLLIRIAAFELEAVLLPNRPPSSTIAVNRHAQFKPHKVNYMFVLLVVAGPFITISLLAVNQAAADLFAVSTLPL